MACGVERTKPIACLTGGDQQMLVVSLQNPVHEGKMVWTRAI